MTTTQTTTSVPRADARELQPLAGRFKTWRATRRRGEHIPEDIRQAATDLCAAPRLSPTVAGAETHYNDLER